MFILVWHNAWRDGVISICNYFCNQATIVICSLYLPLVQTGAYSIGVQIASAIAQIAGTLYNAYQPELQSAYITHNITKIRGTMSVIIMSFIYLFILGTLGFIIVGLPLLRMVKPTTVVSIPVLLGLCLYQFSLKFRNCYTSYFACTNRILYVKGFVVSAIVCFVLSFVLISPFNLGIRGLISAQIISQTIFNVWYWPIKAHKEIGLSASQMLQIGTDEIMKVIKGFF